MLAIRACDVCLRQWRNSAQQQVMGQGSFFSGDIFQTGGRIVKRGVVEGLSLALVSMDEVQVAFLDFFFLCVQIVAATTCRAYLA